MEPTVNSQSQTTHQDKKATILITGATGTIGRELVSVLVSQGIPLRVMVRSRADVSTFDHLPGVDVVIGDFNDPASLAEALRGMEKVFLLTRSSEQAEEQQLRFVEQAERAGVRHLVKLSQLAADKQSPVRFLRYHAVVEEAIRQTGIPFTFLRPNLFMQGLLGFRSTIAALGQFFASIGNARVSMIDVRDIAAVAAATLTEAGHEGKTYTLTGPQAITHAEVAHQLATVLEHPVQFVDIPPLLMREELRKVSFPDWQADGLIEDYAHYARGEADEITSDVLKVTGQPPRPFARFAQDYAPAFTIDIR